MAILPFGLCRTFLRSFLFLFPFSKCPLTLITFIIFLNHRQQAPCQRFIYKLWNLSGIDIIYTIAVHIPPPQSTPNRSRCAPKPRRLRTAAADIVHRKSTHKQTPAETFPPP